MAVPVSASPPGPMQHGAHRGTARQRWLKPDWPFTWLFLGFPLWWALGLGAMIQPFFAVVMAMQLLQRRSVRLPRGFGLWCLYILWVIGSAVGLNQGQPIAYVYRLVMYLSITVFFVWIYNAPRDVLPAAKVFKVLTTFFFIVLVGGWLGVLMPSGGFRSPLELLLASGSSAGPHGGFIPASIATSPFVQTLVHPAFAQVQNFLGYPIGRPKAPFVYTNDWGAVYALLCPLFLAVWLQDPRKRVKGYLILGASLVPVFLSLNRGLWLSLGIALLYAGTRSGPVGSFSRKALASLAVVAFILLVFTPLSAIVQDRAANGNSDTGRAYLYSETWKAVKHSPIIGYGGPLPADKTRILPAIGTQGQFWNVLISQGVVGTVLFVGFLLRITWATRRGPTVTFWAHVVLIVGLVQLLVYDMMPTPLHLLFIIAAVGLRELHAPERAHRRPTAARITPPDGRPVNAVNAVNTVDTVNAVNA